MIQVLERPDDQISIAVWVRGALAGVIQIDAPDDGRPVVMRLAPHRELSGEARIARSLVRLQEMKERDRAEQYAASMRR